MSDTNLWLWQDPDKRYESNVIEYVRDIIGTDKNLVVLKSSHQNSLDGQQFLEYIIELCQEMLLLENRRTTFLNYKDHLLALELCISQVKRKKCNMQIEVKTKEVLECHHAYVADPTSDLSDINKEYLQAYKDFLTHSNCCDVWLLRDLLKQRDVPAETHCNSVFLIVGCFESDISMQLAKSLSSGNSVFNVLVESPLDASLECSPGGGSKRDLGAINVSKEVLSFEDIAATSSSATMSATTEYGEDVILAFLNLLVNCRNELALSRAMICPLVNLSHSAFTDLKHASMSKDMPMCQTVISYVTRIRLGGKSYAPPSTCPLLKHLKGLELFVDLLNRLQTIVEEEDMSEQAIKKVINVLKKKLLKCPNNFRASSIEEAAQSLIETSSGILKRTDLVMGDKESPQIGQRAFNALNALVNNRASRYHCADPELILSQMPIGRTPLNLPPLMGYFRTPDEDSCSQSDSRSSYVAKETTKAETMKVKLSSMSYFHSNNSNSTQTSCLGESTPTKLNFKNCLKDEMSKENAQHLPRVQEKKKGLQFRENTGVKRSILGDVSNSKKAKTAKSTVTKKKTTAKTKQQMKGQGQITNFFCKK